MNRVARGFTGCCAALLWFPCLILLVACQTPGRPIAYKACDIDGGNRCRVWTQDLPLGEFPVHPNTREVSTVSLGTTVERGNPDIQIEIRVRTFLDKPSGVGTSEIARHSFPVVVNSRKLDPVNSADEHVEEWWIMRTKRADLTVPPGARGPVVKFSALAPLAWRVPLPRAFVTQFLKTVAEAKARLNARPTGGDS